MSPQESNNQISQADWAAATQLKKNQQYFKTLDNSDDQYTNAIEKQAEVLKYFKSKFIVREDSDND